MRRASGYFHSRYLLNPRRNNTPIPAPTVAARFDVPGETVSSPLLLDDAGPCGLAVPGGWHGGSGADALHKASEVMMPGCATSPMSAREAALIRGRTVVVIVVNGKDTAHSGAEPANGKSFAVPLVATKTVSGTADAHTTTAPGC